MGVLYAYLIILRCARYTSSWGFRTLLVSTNRAMREPHTVERAKSAAPRFSFCVLTLLIIYPLLVAGGEQKQERLWRIKYQKSFLDC